MKRLLPIATLLLALPACSKEAPKPAAEADGGGPQIATSIDDYALPVDRSDQITAIDAATGDAQGMPRDGGAAITVPKVEPRPVVQPAEASNAAAPLVVPPPPPVVAPAPAAVIPIGGE